MVKQYPHTMKWTPAGTPPTTDPSTGFPVPGNPASEKSAKCRYENFRQSNHKEFTGADGKTIMQKGTIFVQFGQEVPELFDRVTVTDDATGEKEYEGHVLNVYTGQMNSTVAV